MEAVLDFGRGCQNLSIILWGVCEWGGGVCGKGGGGLWCASWLPVITFEGGVRGGGEEVSLDKQAMFAYLPSAFSSPSISLLQCLLGLFLAGCEALSR
jgi:hypothetical protein